MNFYFIWATPILLNISRESFFILFTYAQKPIPNAQIDNEVFRSGAPLYIVSKTVVTFLLFEMDPNILVQPSNPVKMVPSTMESARGQGV